jgi:hypothetical protein
MGIISYVSSPLGRFYEKFPKKILPQKSGSQKIVTPAHTTPENLRQKGNFCPKLY